MPTPVQFAIKGLLGGQGKCRIIDSLLNLELPLSLECVLPFSGHLFHKFMYEAHARREGAGFAHPSPPRGTEPVKQHPQ